jgi:hypothetical protein
MFTPLQLIIIGSLIIIFLIGLLMLFLPMLKDNYASKHLNKIFNKIIYKTVHIQDYYLIPNVKIKLPGNDMVIIDHLVFGDKFIYAIKDLYFKGGLLGKPDDKDWQYYTFKGKKDSFTFIPNPYYLNQKRIEKLSIVTGLDQRLFISIILVNNATLIDQIPFSNDRQYIVNIRRFKKLIKAIENRDVPAFKKDILAKAVLDVNRINQGQ